ncbi:SemiSWEET transporter [Candidatus Methylospira mobilis]|nr:SemiSWEET transporter [Candidatus Methylospira mobilis]WNV06447.1 SemiSWEET transporter [Candidatus Methylospira mobilis]
MIERSNQGGEQRRLEQHTPTKHNKTMENNELIGLVAGTLTTVSFVPQVLKTWKSRSAKDISLGMFLMFSLGVALWLIYGIGISSMPVILANAITLVLAIGIILMKVTFK